MPGDLLIKVTINGHSEFVKEGLDIVSSLELNFAEAALGCSKSVRSIHGNDISILIEPGINSGDQITLKGRV